MFNLSNISFNSERVRKRLLPILLALIVIVFSGAWYIKLRNTTPQGNEKANVPKKDQSTSYVSNDYQTLKTTPQSGSSNWKSYFDKEFGISFEYPATWKISESVDPFEDYRSLDILGDNQAYIRINRETNPDNLSPRQWYEKNRESYHPVLNVVIEETEALGYPVLVFGQPRTCETYAAIYVAVGFTDSILIFTQAEDQPESNAFELAHLLSTLSRSYLSNQVGPFANLELMYPPLPYSFSCKK